MTSLATLGKVCTPFLFLFNMEQLVNCQVVWFLICTTKYKQALWPSQFEAEFNFNAKYYILYFCYSHSFFHLYSFLFARFKRVSEFFIACAS